MNDLMLEENNRAALDLSFPDFSGTNESSGYAQGFKYMRRRVWNAVALGVSDALAISLALLLAGIVRKVWFGASMIPIWGWLVIAVWWAVAIGQRLLPSWGLGAVEELRRVAILLAGVYGAEAVAIFLAKESEEV